MYVTVGVVQRVVRSAGSREIPLVQCAGTVVQTETVRSEGIYSYVALLSSI